MLDETVALAARIAAHPRAATRASTSLVRAARRDAVVEANRREQAAFATLLGAAVGQRHPGRVRRPAHRRVLTVRLGITAALTDVDLAPAVLAAAVEELGFDSLYLPEHTHLPVRGGHAARHSSAACASTTTSAASTRWSRWPRRPRCTTRIGLGTGILLAAQHEPILLAKQVATLDHLSGGRVTLGVGFGWNRTEAEDHGVDWAAPPRRGARAPGRHGGHLVRRPGRVPRRVRRLRADLVLAQAGAAAPRPHPRRRRAPTRPSSPPSSRAPTAGSPSAAAASAPPSPACTRWPSEAGRDPARARASSPSAPSPTRASSSTTPGWASPRSSCGSGPATSAAVRAELESLAPLVPFAATLEQP